MPKSDATGRLSATESLRVPFHDVDPANVVWHGRYFKYFEEARRTLFEDIGYGFEEMLESGFIWPIVDANVRFVHPLRVDQRFSVTAELAEWELRIVVDYLIHDLDGKVCTKGRTVQVPLDAETMELRLGTPEVLVQKIERSIARAE